MGRSVPCGLPSEGNVIVLDGIVHLWGFVPSEGELVALRVAAEGLQGVKGFENHTFSYFSDIGAKPRTATRVVLVEPRGAPDAGSAVS
jgi:hypothetical protein